MDQKTIIIFAGVVVMTAGVFLVVIFGTIQAMRPNSPNTLNVCGITMPTKFVPLGVIVLGCVLILSQMGGSYWARFVH